MRPGATRAARRGLFLVACGLESVAVGADLDKQAGWGIELPAITGLSTFRVENVRSDDDHAFANVWIGMG